MEGGVARGEDDEGLGRGIDEVKVMRWSVEVRLYFSGGVFQSAPIYLLYNQRGLK